MSKPEEIKAPTGDGLSYSRRSLLTGHREGQATPDELEAADNLQKAFVDPATVTTTGEGQYKAALVVARRTGFNEGFESAISSLPDLSRLAALPDAVSRLEALLAQNNNHVTTLATSVQPIDTEPISPISGSIAPNEPSTQARWVRRAVNGSVIFLVGAAALLLAGLLYGIHESSVNEEKNIEKTTVGLEPFPPSPEGWIVNYLPFDERRGFEPTDLNDGSIRVRNGERVRFSRLDLRNSSDLIIEAYYNPNKSNRKIVRLATYKGSLRTALHLPEDPKSEIDNRALRIANVKTGEEYLVAIQPYFAGSTYQDSTFDLTLVKQILS